jgi:hypothetical protein
MKKSEKNLNAYVGWGTLHLHLHLLCLVHVSAYADNENKQRSEMIDVR